LHNFSIYFIVVKLFRLLCHKFDHAFNQVKEVRLIYQEEKFFMNIDGVRIYFHIIVIVIKYILVIDYQILVIWKIVGLVYLSNNRASTRPDETRSVFNCRRNILVKKKKKGTSRPTSIQEKGKKNEFHMPLVIKDWH